MLNDNSIVLPEHRRGALRKLLADGQKVRFCEAHSGYSAIVSDQAVSSTGTTFDGHWISSLTCSASRGLPDMEIYIAERRLEMIEEICFVSSKAVMVDADTGGDATSLEYFVRRLEMLGVSAVVVEDKRHPKRNSLDGTMLDHLEDPAVFVNKIKRAKKTMLTGDMLFISRLESLIVGAGVQDAIDRARMYIDAGSDGIMIHSKSNDMDEILEFCTTFLELCDEIGKRVPLMCVPTTFNNVRATDLFDQGFDIVVHANHLLRASHKAMSETCQMLLDNDMSACLGNSIVPVKEIFRLTGYHAAMDREKTTSTEGS